MKYHSTYLGFVLIAICLSYTSQSWAAEQSPGITPQELIRTLEQQKSELQQLKEALGKQQAELAKANETKYSNWNVYGVPILSPLASIIAAIGGWYITYSLLKRNFTKQEEFRRDDFLKQARLRSKEWARQDRIRREDLAKQEATRKHEEEEKEKERMELYLVDSLKYFEGGTQNRNIGIAFVQAYWKKFPQLQETWTAILSNQAIYILTKLLEDKALTLHEFNNLERIFSLLKKGTLEPYQNDQIAEVLNRFTVNTISDNQLKERIERWQSEFKT